MSTSSATVITRGTKVTGRIETTGALVLEGRVEGTILAASITITPTGVAVAEIAADVADIRGVVIGNVVARERIAVAAGARVVGDLHAPAVELAAGAVLEGSVDRAVPTAAVEPTTPATRGTMQPRAPLSRPAAPPTRTTQPPQRGIPGLPNEDSTPPFVPPMPRPASRARLVPRRGRDDGDT